MQLLKAASASKSSPLTTPIPADLFQSDSNSNESLLQIFCKVKQPSTWMKIQKASGNDTILKTRRGDELLIMIEGERNRRKVKLK